MCRLVRFWLRITAIRKLFVLAALFMVLSYPFLTILNVEASIFGETVEIMPLGDSITLGYPGEVGYRQKLYVDLANSGLNVSFVGSQDNGASEFPPAFNTAHEGHDGWTDAQIAANVYGFLQNNPAEIVLLHIGTNVLDTSSADVENILDEIDRFEADYSTSVIVIVARIINHNIPIATVTAFNDNVEAMVDTRISEGDLIVNVDMENALDYPGDMADTLHPNEAGYEKMADVWYNALIGLIGDTPNFPPIVSAISGPTSGYRGDTITLTATAYDPNDEILTFEWLIDSEAFPNQTDETFTFTIMNDPTAVGFHSIYVRAKDPEGEVSSWKSMSFTTQNNAPNVSDISGPTSGYRNKQYTFNATGSDVEGDRLVYEWYLDGTYASGGSSLTHTFGSADLLRDYEIKVRVQDFIGNYSSYSTLTFALIEEPNDSPIISEITGPESATVGDTCTFTASASDPDGDLPLTITWYIDGTSRSTGTSFVHMFDMEAAGVYLIQALASDSRGASSNYSNHTIILMEKPGPFYCSFEVPFEEDSYVVETWSNSTVANLTFNEEIKRIRFNVTGSTGTESFCDITIPTELLSGDFTVFMDDTRLTEGVDYIITSNSTHTTLNIVYEHSSHMIDVFGTTSIPDFASWLFLPSFMFATFLGLALRKRLKTQHYQKP